MLILNITIVAPDSFYKIFVYKQLLNGSTDYVLDNYFSGAGIEEMQTQISTD